MAQVHSVSRHKMRVPQVRVKFYHKNLFRKDARPQFTGCPVCRQVCVDERKKLSLESNRLSRSTSKWMKDLNNYGIIIYETYRCMPLLGDETIHAPDWEEHVVRYRIVFVKN